jgi:Na+/melibiose symporter-like transporter
MMKRSMSILIVVVAAALVVITFTPVVLSPGKIEPKLLSLPYTLWISIVITVILVLLTYLASRLRDND